MPRVSKRLRRLAEAIAEPPIPDQVSEDKSTKSKSQKTK